jgi:colicin import membrane protein
LKFSWSEPGTVVSAAAHAALLLATLIAFSGARKFDDAQESVPVETVTDAQFNQIMKGDKTAKPSPQPHPKVDKVASVEVQKPRPPTPDAKTDVPAPPPPLKHTADPGHDEQVAEAETPPVPVAALPPPRPQPAEIEPPIPEPRPQTQTPPTPAKTQPEAKKPPPPPKPDAEPIENAGKPRTKAEVQPPPPVPPAKPRVLEKKVQAKPKTAPKTLNEDAKLLDQLAAVAAEKPVKPSPKPPAKPKSGDETAKPSRHADFDQIRQILSHEDPQSTGSTGRQLTKVAALGAATANADKMTPTLLGELDEILIEQYKECWRFIGFDSQQKYTPMIEVAYNRDGSLRGEPSLLNAPANPALRSIADSALAAVNRCNPLRIPAQFQPYFEQWKGPRVLRFDPTEMSG